MSTENTTPTLAAEDDGPVTVSITEEELTMAPAKRLEHEHLDGIQHGIDDNPEHDAAKGGVLGAAGGAVMGLAAGSMLGAPGAALGALVGAAAGALASGLAVAAVDTVDNDNNVTGIGAEITIDPDEVPTEEITDIVREEYRSEKGAGSPG